MNRSTETTAHDHTARIARLAWFCAFVLPLVLACLLLGVKAAPAAPLPPAAIPFAFEEEGEEEQLALDEDEELEDEAEFAEAECEIASEEADEGEITQSEADALCREAKEFVEAGRDAGAEPCPLRSARAHASTRNGRLKLTIGYTTAASVPATIQVRRVGTFRRRLGRSGVIRLTKKVGGKQVKRIKIRIRVPSSAGGRRCGLVQVVANKVV